MLTMAKKDETFLLVSLEENKAKQLAQLVSNDSCRKILEFLSKNTERVTESLIARELGIPLPTVHYNLKNLLAAGLVKVEEFHYSPKGKEVNHYSLANKFIIIAPTGTEKLPSKLRSLLPVLLASVITGGLIQLYSYLRSPIPSPATLPGVFDAAVKSAPALTAAPETALQEAAVEAIRDAGQAQAKAYTFVLPENIALWFVIGAVFAIAAFFLFQKISEMRRERGS
ncbi:hypothetical protein COT48_04345 [Candidatus Woesearchaeota archaeon CG08_land_8_20_14_0_20_47_9]|nr:MAG: hypothetical protein COV22_00215 [Candidatus Woesearchaeota archaeon CG10_big_fil_rev_8_21_14_0_10_47_5]PIO03573.1 MAG: hypothetical protein COT48_04345 [Candidatus Woesearchaeota archaeon CG08_land_8_20_14_0_20_47_9]